MQMKTGLTQSRLKELLAYDEATGAFVWRASKSVAGGLAKHGYHRIRVDGRSWWSHRLAWLYVHGELPVGAVDHIDGNRANNAIANLRPATNKENQANRGPKKTNATGIKGATWHSQLGRWQARITVDGKNRSLGMFDTAEEAGQAYDKAAREIHGEFARSAHSE